MAGLNYLQGTLTLLDAVICALVRLFTICSDAVAYCLGKFEPTIEYAVDAVCQLGQALKRDGYSFVAKVSGEPVSACDGFVSMRRSLDASALA